jgi:protein-disulfide isomerase
MVEFSDFNCPYCGRFARDTLSPLLENYEGQVQFVYRDFPILGESSLQAALAGKCADDEGVFWEYHDLLFENQGSLDRTLFLSLAETLELDTAQFAACLDDPATSDEVLADFTEGQRLSVSGTPTFFINGRRVVGAQPYQAFQVVIDEEIAAARNTTPASEAPE